MLVRLEPGTRYGTVKIPSSKSLAHRALICAALADRDSVISCSGISRDIEATMECLKEFGAAFEVREDLIRVTPVWGDCSGYRSVQTDRTDRMKGTALQDSNAVILPCRESGSTLRFLLPLAGALGRGAVFQMEGRLPLRPMQEYEKVLEEHDMKIRREGDRLCCEGQLTPGEYLLPGNISSQYFTGLLFALPLLDGESRIRILGKAESADYIRLTESALSDAGITVEKLEDGWLVPGGQHYRTTEGNDPAVIEGDYSGGAFFLCAGAFSGQGIRCDNLSSASMQGDRRILDILQQFGAQVEVRDKSISVRKGTLHGIDIDGSMIPDILPVLSVVAAAAEGTTRIYHAERLRMKESDRILSTLTMLKALGAEAEETEDGMRIQGTGSLKGGAEVDPFGDHRIAMSAAVAACICREPVSIRDSECVEKSYPDFWKDYHSLQIERISTGRNEI